MNFVKGTLFGRSEVIVCPSRGFCVRKTFQLRSVPCSYASGVLLSKTAGTVQK